MGQFQAFENLRSVGALRDIANTRTGKGPGRFQSFNCSSIVAALGQLQRDEVPRRILVSAGRDIPETV